MPPCRYPLLTQRLDHARVEDLFHRRHQLVGTVEQFRSSNGLVQVGRPRSAHGERMCDGRVFPLPEAVEFDRSDTHLRASVSHNLWGGPRRVRGLFKTDNSKRD